MDRRNFIRTSAGFVAVAISPGVFSIKSTEKIAKKIKFKNYQKETSFGDVKIVTPDDGYYIHSFFDICPFSPTEKYLAVNKLPYQGKKAQFGDKTEICIIDLENETIETVYATKGWAYQLGANLEWGKTDRYLYTNDIINNQAVCVRIDLETREIKAYSGPKYNIAPDESAVIGFPLDTINVTQMGYGVPKFKEYDKIQGAPPDQGLWKTDLATGKKQLLVSLRDIFEKIDNTDLFKEGNFYLFHSKYNPQGTQIFQVVRCIFPANNILKGWNPMLFTFNSNGNDIHQTISREQWSFGGNHPNWHPDGEHIIMNLTPKWLGQDQMRFCQFHHTGKDFKILTDKFRGSGHPSVNQDSSYLISDYYVSEYKKLDYKKCPIRLINLDTEEEVHICTVFTDLEISDATFRIDPHPVWSRDYRKVCFNGAPDGIRQVFVADLDKVI